jgi:hypothetical protein
VRKALFSKHEMAAGVRDCGMMEGCLNTQSASSNGCILVPRFSPLGERAGIFGDPQARLISLVRRGKKHSVGRVARCIGAGTTAGADGHGIGPVETTAYT